MAGVPIGGSPEADVQTVVYAISHDLQAPTRHIRSFLDVLVAHLGESFDEEAAGYAERIQNAVEDLQTKLEALTRYSRVVSRAVEPSPCDAASALDDALAELTLGEDRANLVVGALPWVLADRQQLVTVFIELIGNAVKFSPEHSQIRIHSVSEDDRHVICIEDAGPGFREKDAAVACELFKRFHAMSIPGTGTGLALVQRIVARHGGQVELRPNEGPGTTVQFSLQASDHRLAGAA